MKNIFTALSSTRMFWTLAGMLGLLHFFWMLTLPFWPFTDLPNHLAVAAIYRDYDAPDSLYRNYVLLERLFQPNTFFPWFCSLPFFASVEQGARVFYGLYILALPLSVWSLLRRLGGDGRPRSVVVVTKSQSNTIGGRRYIRRSSHANPACCGHPAAGSHGRMGVADQTRGRRLG